MSNINALQSSYKNCNICSNITGNPVLGYGNENASLMFVSLAPLDKKTKGKLESILSYMKMGIEDVWVTTTVKHITPNAPLECINNCKSFLLEEIDIIKPKIIILSGQDALYSFFPDRKLSTTRGAVFESFEYPELLFCCIYNIAEMVLDNDELKKLKSRSKMEFENYNKRYLELTYDINKLIEILKEV